MCFLFPLSPQKVSNHHSSERRRTCVAFSTKCFKRVDIDSSCAADSNTELCYRAHESLLGLIFLVLVPTQSNWVFPQLELGQKNKDLELSFRRVHSIWKFLGGSCGVVELWSLEIKGAWHCGSCGWSMSATKYFRLRLRDCSLTL